MTDPKRRLRLEQGLRAVASRRRLDILSFLKREHSAIVSDIAQAVHLSIYTTSQHLRILKAAGIVDYAQRGRFVSYRLSLKQEEPLQSVIRML